MVILGGDNYSPPRVTILEVMVLSAVIICKLAWRIMLSGNIQVLISHEGARIQLQIE